MSNKLVLFLIVVLLILVSAGAYFIYKGQQEETPNSFQPEVKNASYSVVDTGQSSCYDDSNKISCPSKDEDYYGQDAQYDYVPFSYADNGDGTVIDNNTGLVWQKSADLNKDGSIDIDDKKNQEDSQNYCSGLTLAGKDDWRLPNIKTLYSLMDFSGTDPSIGSSSASDKPFINTKYFDFAYGDESVSERNIDSQWATTTIYVFTVMNNQKAMFGLNLADGRIKGYPVTKLFYVKCVRGNEDYGVNSFEDNNDGTITDKATELIWQKEDSEKAVNWNTALSSCENLNLAGQSDWRLPNAKELQSILDYTKSPDTSNSAAIDSVFKSTSLTNENDQKDWGFYWTSTTHLRSNGSADNAVYIAFGRALGYMRGIWMDVHGAGAQRSDPKVPIKLTEIKNDPQNAFKVIGDAISHGPQGDVVRGLNYFRCVRGQSDS